MIRETLSQIRDFFGENNEFVDSTNIALRERLTSPFLGYFLVSWCILNWKIIYATIFVSQEAIFQKYGLLKIEYLTQYVFPSPYWFHLIILPAISTTIIFWVLPYLTRPYFRKSIRNQKALKRIEIQENLEIKKEEKKLIQEETKVIDEGIKKAKQEKKAQAETPELLWEKEFINFRRSPIFRKFDQILDSIYKYDGKIRARSEGSYTFVGYDFEVDKEILIYADTNGLIKLTSGNIASLTDKGRFFAQRYSQVRNGVVSSVHPASA